MSFFLTQERVGQAIGLVLPTISAMMERGQTNQQNLHIVVTDPTKPFLGDIETFPNSVLYEVSLGEQTQWENPCNYTAPPLDLNQ